MKIISEVQNGTFFWNHFLQEYSGEYNVVQNQYISVFEEPDKEGNIIIQVHSPIYAVTPTDSADEQILTIFCTHIFYTYHIDLEKKPLSDKQLYDLIMRTKKTQQGFLKSNPIENVPNLWQYCTVWPLETYRKNLDISIQRVSDFLQKHG